MHVHLLKVISYGYVHLKLAITLLMYNKQILECSYVCVCEHLLAKYGKFFNNFD